MIFQIVPERWPFAVHSAVSLGATAILLAWSCPGQAQDSEPSLQGIWVWELLNEGYPCCILTPESTGTTQYLAFGSDSVDIYQNGDLVESVVYTVNGDTLNIDTAKAGWQLPMRPLQYRISDQLVLSQFCVDCMTTSWYAPVDSLPTPIEPTKWGAVKAMFRRDPSN